MIEKFHFHRFEFKYLVDKRIKDAMLKDLLRHMDYDIPYELDSDFYEVLNLYLDSHNLKFYREKVDGLMFRRKMRFRFYTANPSEHEHVYVEIKRKRNMTIIKDRVKLPYDDAFNIANRSFSGFLEKMESFGQQEKDVLSEFLFEIMKNRLSSRLWVNYKRTALAAKDFPKLRITFDDDIITSKARDGFGFDLRRGSRRIFRNKSIFEVKYNGTLPYWVHGLIQKYGLFREPISKYCNAIENLVI
jgi:hypothetical protein